MFKNELCYGIPDYLDAGTFLVLIPILYSNSKSNSSDVLDKMIKEATKNNKKDIIIIQSKLDIDWGHYFILIPENLIENNILKETNLDESDELDKYIQYVDNIPDIPLRSLAYDKDTNFSEILSKNSYSIKNLSLWLQTICQKKHILISDRHGDLVHPVFLKCVISALCNSHTDLIFEPLIKESVENPIERINDFYNYKNPKLYIDTYEHALTRGINIIPGDFAGAQPEVHPNYEDYVNIRYKINAEIAHEIKQSKNLTISFYGCEHIVSRRKNNK
jgi:hypothetical protein